MVDMTNFKVTIGASLASCASRYDIIMTIQYIIQDGLYLKLQSEYNFKNISICP